MPHEDPTNIAWVCEEHAPRPQAQFAQRAPSDFIGAFVKRAFSIRRSAGREHMWVIVTGVTADGHLAGVLDNDPVSDVGVACGAVVVVRLDEIEAVLEAETPEADA